MTRRRWLTVSILGAALLLIVGRFVSGLYVDYSWYSAMGAGEVWRTRMGELAILRIVAGLVATAFVFLNLYAVRQSIASLVLPRRVANLEIGEEVPRHFLFAAVAALSLIIGVLLSLGLDDWKSLVLASDGVLFQESDPYFQYDLGFFVYWLPFETALRNWALIVLAVVTAAVVILYALTPSLRWERGALRVSGYVRRHFTALGTVLFLLLAWSYRLDAYALLVDGSGVSGAFTMIDHRVGIPVNLLLAFLTASAAILVLWAGWTGQARIAFGTVTAVLALSLGLRQLLPPLMKRVLSPADPVARERPYIATRAGYTRQAYGVSRIVRDDSSIAFASPREAAFAVSLWDPPALSRAVERSQRQGTVSEPLGWAADSSRLIAQVVQRPIGPEGADPLTPWMYTPVFAAVSDDRGNFIPADGAPADPEPIPAAFVFDGATGYLMVSDRAGNIPGPSVETAGARLAHAWDQQNLRLLFGDLPHPQPKMLLKRDVRTRIRAIAPFFEQGRSLTPIVHADTLLWALHLYSATAWYPLSDRIRAGVDTRVSYLYHAATALVNATTGRLTLVPDSVLDPIATSWMRRFPELFTGRDALPSDLVARFPPAIDAAVAQAVAFGRFGGRGETPPSWRIPASAGGDTLFAGGEDAPFLTPRSHVAAWSTTLVDATDRVRGVIVATGGTSLETHWVQLKVLGPRWPSVIQLLQRSPDSAAAPAGSRLVRGRVRTIPLRDSAVYLQTSYAWKAEGAPAVTRVAVLVGDSVATGRSLADIVGMTDARARAARVPATVSELRDRVQSLYETMRDALRRGDWGTYGTAFEELGRLLRTVPR